ncbi:MAG: hypothetical protein HY941_11590 [Gammaproteobacteria bacterium]|nr:hypothetical protein [Gammaproteobacteria bacterium]
MSNTTLLDRARRLVGKTALVALSLAAAPVVGHGASLVHDYSAVGEYSNSGFFTGALDESAAAATVQGLGFKLTGSQTVSDSMFWAWNDYYQMTVRKYDTTGIAFVWGGALDGALSGGETLSAPFDFNIDFSHTAPSNSAYDYPGVGWTLTVGFRGDAYTPGQGLGPDMYALYSNSTSGWMDAAGSYQFTGSVDAMIDEWSAANAISWYAMLSVEWHDPLAYPGWEDTAGTMNGDYLTVTIPNQSIDVALLPAVSAVPVPGAFWLLSSGLLGIVSFSRRVVR